MSATVVNASAGKFIVHRLIVGSFPSIYFKAIDAVYFNGVNPRGDILAIGTAQRKNQRVDGFCLLRVPEFSDRVLVNTRFPDCWLEQTVAESESTTSWSVEGIKVCSVTPMKTWKLSYSGKMK